MIQVNELRIGSHIIFGELPDVVCGLNNDGSYLSTSGEILPLSDCTGIPLTEEILLKCGFVRQITTPHIMELIAPELGEEGYIEHIDGNFTLTKEGSGYYNDYFGLYDRIKYLHQLQNLYFALTGKELQINL